MSNQCPQGNQALFFQHAEWLHTSQRAPTQLCSIQQALPAHLHRRHLLGLLGGHLEDGSALLLKHPPVPPQLAQLLPTLSLESRRLLQLRGSHKEHGSLFGVGIEIWQHAKQYGCTASLPHQQLLHHPAPTLRFSNAACSCPNRAAPSSSSSRRGAT